MKHSIDLMKLLPNNHPKYGIKIDKIIDGNKIEISWVNKDRKGRILNPQNQPKPLTIPRYITLDQKSGEVLGLYFGDGTKDDISCIELANSCPELIILWITHLSEFGIDIDKLNFKIKLSENARLKYDVTEGEIEKYWRNVISIPTDKKIKIMWIKTKGKPSTYIRKYGSLVVTYYYTIFSLFYNTLIRNITEFLNQNEFRIGFMKGLIAAEGNINLRKNGSLSLVRIAGNKKIRKFVKETLSKYFKIRSKEDKNNQLYIWGYSSLKKIHNLKLYSLHPNKKQLFEKGYTTLVDNLNRKHNDNSLLENEKVIKLLRLLTTKPLETDEIIKEYNSTRDRIKQILNGYKSQGKYKYNGLRNLGLVSCERNKDRRCQKIWKITRDGKTFLENLTKDYNQHYPDLESKSLH